MRLRSKTLPSASPASRGGAANLQLVSIFRQWSCTPPPQPVCGSISSYPIPPTEAVRTLSRIEGPGHDSRMAGQIVLLVLGNVGLFYSLEKKSVEAAPWEMPLSPGAYGPRVAAWQQSLNQVANSALIVDGRFGATTEEATRQFQRASELKVDGIVGPITRVAMEGCLPPIRTPSW